MSQSPVIQAIKVICEEKNLPFEMVVETVESALAAAYRKDFGEINQNIKVEMDKETGDFVVFDIKTVVEDKSEEELQREREEFKKEIELGAVDAEKKRFNPKTEIMISGALKNKPDAVLGETIKMELTIPEAFGRMAAQTAKQVIVQKIREAEKETVFNEFKSKESEVIVGVIQRKEGNLVLVDLGHTIGILPFDEQIAGENYISGKRMKFLLIKVDQGVRGTEVRLSRAHPNFLKKLFEFEIPEMKDKTVEIVMITREAGSRSKVAVRSLVEGIDPIGSCVGQRGVRIQAIISELNNEKIDIVEYSDDPKIFIAHALSPSKVTETAIDESRKIATVIVPDSQLSLAIGKAGQNVRLAARLTGWKINIKEEKSAKEEVKEEKVESPEVNA